MQRRPNQRRSAGLYAQRFDLQVELYPANELLKFGEDSKPGSITISATPRRPREQ